MSDERTQHGQPHHPGEAPGPDDSTPAADPRQPGEPGEPTPPATPEWPAAPDPYRRAPEAPGGPQQWPSASGGPPPQWPAPPPVEPQAGAAGVHPLDVGRAFGVGWSLFRFRWKALLGSALAVMVPAYLLQSAISLYATDAASRWAAAVQAAAFGAVDAGEQLDFGDLPPFPVEAVLASFLGAILLGIASIVVAGALVHIIGWTYGGAKATAGAALRQSLARLPSLFGAGFLVGLTIFLIVLGGVVLMFALFAAVGFEPGPLALLGLIVIVSTFVAVVFLTIRWQFYAQAVMLEGAGAVESLGRSWRLVSGSGWRVLGYLLLLTVVIVIVGMIIGVLMVAVFGLGVDMTTGRPLPYDAGRAAGQTLLSGLASVLVLPFYTAVMTLLYYDLRWRRQEPIGPPPA